MFYPYSKFKVDYEQVPYIMQHIDATLLHFPLLEKTRNNATDATSQTPPAQAFYRPFWIAAGPNKKTRNICRQLFSSAILYRVSVVFRKLNIDMNRTLCEMADFLVNRSPISY